MASMLLNNRKLFALSLAGVALAALAVTTGLLSQTQDASANAVAHYDTVSAGSNFTCGLTNAGGVKCWGDNTKGQTGPASHNFCFAACNKAPVSIPGLESGVMAVSAGEEHACAVMGAGAAVCWGANSQGQLGDGTTTGRSTPASVTGLESGVAAVSAGDDHTCAVTAAGAAKCWGSNQNGQLGDGTTTSSLVAVDVQGLSTGVAAISAGGLHTCALTSSGGIKCWGYNWTGQLGDGGSLTQELVPVDVSGLTSGVASIDVGEGHSCAVTSSGGAKCWGSNIQGLVGDGTFTTSPPYGRTTPVDVYGMSSNVVQVDAGRYVTCARTTLGAKCWGNGWSGALGNGTSGEEAYSAYPAIVSGYGIDIVGITTGGIWASSGQHSCGVVASGTAKCWGQNYEGQLGNPSSANIQPLPASVAGSPKGTPPPQPTSTPTNTPTTVPSPTATVTPCPPPCLTDFSMGVNIDGMGPDECNTSGGPTTCPILIGTMFTLNAYLNRIGDPEGYEALNVYTAYTGVSIDFVSNMNPNMQWPGCVFEGNGEGPGYVATGCSLGISSAPVFYTGRVATAMFACTADGTITMVHGQDETAVYIPQQLYETGGDETLTIDCLEPAPYPTDTDGDGCPDTKEAGTIPMQGGLRDFTDSWDYFNPTHDGLNRIDDALLVKEQYYIDQGEPGYMQDTDRTLAGPYAWNSGPPDGLQRVDDMLNVIKQYFHDCS